MEQKLQTIAILVDNSSGVLSQVSRLFSRKGYNIESLSVGATEKPNISRMTIDVYADDNRMTLLAHQLLKLFSVHSLKILDRSNSVLRELMLIKIKTENADKRNEIIQLANVFKAKIIDVSISTLTLLVVNNSDSVSAIEKVLNEFDVIELARTGGIALERGISTVNDDTKEKKEFNYGKNVL